MGDIRLDFCGVYPGRFRELFDNFNCVERYLDGYFDELRAGAWFTLRDVRNVACLFRAFDDEIKSGYNSYDRAWKYCESMFVWFVRCLAEGRVFDGEVRDIALILDSL